VTIPSADAYVDTMRSAHVLVNRDERAKTMMDRIDAAAKAAGGVHDPEASLVAENASLVEEPFVVTGSFETQFLELPAQVIRAVARGHQKYFVVQKVPVLGAQGHASPTSSQSESELLPKYLAVVNTANSPANITKGMDRVMRARLSDGRFFFEEDKKAKTEDRGEKLGRMVFHNLPGCACINDQ